MHPAFSVILLTTLLGVGQGLFLALYTGQVYSVANLLPPQDSQSFYGAGSLIALVFLAGGLLASFFHLGHPERAWRSIAKWRTSWLSREVIVLPGFMLLLAIYMAVHWFGWTQPLFTLAGSIPVDASLLAGALATLGAFVLFVCTAMIYASLRFLQEWHTPLTLANYTFLGIASGFTLAAAFSAWIGADLVGFYGLWAVIATLLALVTRAASLIRNRRLKPSPRCRAPSGCATATSSKRPRAPWAARSIPGSSFTGAAPAPLGRSNTPSCCWCSCCRWCYWGWVTCSNPVSCR